MFTDILKKVVDNAEGGLAAVIMGLDGIPVDQYVRVNDRVDVATVGMEFSFIIGQIRKAADSLAVGTFDELTVRAERILIVVRMLTPQYFVAVALAAEGNAGKARFLLRLGAPKLISAL